MAGRIAQRLHGQVEMPLFALDGQGCCSPLTDPGVDDPGLDSLQLGGLVGREQIGVGPADEGLVAPERRPVRRPGVAQVQVLVKNHGPGGCQGHPESLFADDQLFLDSLLSGDVAESEHHPVDDVIRGPIGHDPHLIPVAVPRSDLRLPGRQGLQNVFRVLNQRFVFQIVDDVLQGPADIHFDQVDDGRCLGGETPDGQLLVQENGGYLRGVEQVPHVVVDQGEFIDLGLQLGVDRD